VRSEIVVPIIREGEVLGELDIDSHEISPFTEEDREFLEKVCTMVAGIL
jgi:GAF domain-containing protein